MKKYFISTLIIVVFIIFNSCENFHKDNIIDYNSKNTLYNVNPYDSIGIIHNVLLEYFLNYIDENKIQFDNPYTSRQNFCNQLAYVVQLTYQETGINPSLTYNEAYLMVDTLGIDYGWNLGYLNLDSLYYQTFSDYINKAYIPNSSAKDSLWITKIRDLIVNYSIENLTNLNGDSLKESPEKFLIDINSLESQILNVDWAPYEYKSLKLISLLKHSSTLWYQKIYNVPPIINTKKKDAINIIQQSKKAEFISNMKNFSWFAWVGSADVAGNFIGSSYAALAWEALDRSGF